jgi:hypothetical protein
MTLADLETNNAHFLEYDKKPASPLVSNILSPYTVCTTLVIILVTYFLDMYDSDIVRILITDSINWNKLLVGKRGMHGN